MTDAVRTAAGQLPGDATDDARGDGAVPHDPSRYTILVVEDSPTQAEALRALLDEQGYGVRIARSAETALAVLRDQGSAGSVTSGGGGGGGGGTDAGRNGGPDRSAAAGTSGETAGAQVAPDADLVLSDVVMPGMNGYDLCRVIKDDPALRATPVVLLTSLTDPLDIIRGLECGADNYITKPYDAARLVARLRDVFVNRALRRRAAPGDGVGITFLGERFTVTSSKEQTLDLLVSSFEELVRTNEALRASEVERVRLYERERAARLEAEGANRAKSDFLTAMSHDLRTPLNAIGGYAELLAEEIQGPVTEEQRAYLDRITHNQRHLLSLVNDVLNFARVERGRVSVTITEVPVSELLSGAHAVIDPQMLEKGLTFASPPCDPGVTVLADHERADQVLVNLLANAVKFTPSGGTVTIACAVEPESVTISVSDTGIGIPADRLEAIFDPFVQVDARRTTEQEGIGLGLAISRNLARLMGGELTVASTVGEGSTFSLRLRRPGQQ